MKIVKNAGNKTFERRHIKQSMDLSFKVFNIMNIELGNINSDILFNFLDKENNSMR